MKVLHIDSSLRKEGSVSRQLSAQFIHQLGRQKAIEVDRLDLVDELPPHISQLYAQAMYLPIDQHTEEMSKELARSNALVDRMMEAELYVIGIPMYNFGIPSNFKSFLDHVVRSGRTFQADENGFRGLLTNKKAIIISSRGGEYDSEMTKPSDFVTPYLRLILGFIGVTAVEFVRIEPTTFYGEEAKETAIAKAKEQINSLIQNI